MTPLLITIDARDSLGDAWNPPKIPVQRIVVLFVIQPNGAVTDLRIGTSSGSAVADKAASSAVEKAAPFGKPPSGITSPQKWQFTFECSVCSIL
jgi:TonB family protein